MDMLHCSMSETQAQTCCGARLLKLRATWLVSCLAFIVFPCFSLQRDFFWRNTRNRSTCSGNSEKSTMTVCRSLFPHICGRDKREHQLVGRPSKPQKHMVRAEVRGSARKCAGRCARSAYKCACARGSARKCAEVRGPWLRASARKCAEVRRKCAACAAHSCWQHMVIGGCSSASSACFGLFRRCAAVFCKILEKKENAAEIQDSMQKFPTQRPSFRSESQRAPKDKAWTNPTSQILPKPRTSAQHISEPVQLDRQPLAGLPEIKRDRILTGQP